MNNKKYKNPKYVPGSEAITNLPFWESGVNPITMTKLNREEDQRQHFYDYEH